LEVIAGLPDGDFWQGGSDPYAVTVDKTSTVTEHIEKL